MQNFANMLVCLLFLGYIHFGCSNQNRRRWLLLGNLSDHWIPRFMNYTVVPLVDICHINISLISFFCFNFFYLDGFSWGFHWLSLHAFVKSIFINEGMVNVQYILICIFRALLVNHWPQSTQTYLMFHVHYILILQNKTKKYYTSDPCTGCGVITGLARRFDDRRLDNLVSTLTPNVDEHLRSPLSSLVMTVFGLTSRQQNIVLYFRLMSFILYA